MKNLSAILNSSDNIISKQINTPVGDLTLLASSSNLLAVLWDNVCEAPQQKPLIASIKQTKSHPIIMETQKQLNEYFRGERQEFNLPIALNGTDFQKQAWQQLIKIPYAETISYGEQALRLGNKNKARAVGLANRMNPLSIIIPCHRVIGGNGRLVGFAGGVARKAYLLDLEKRTVNYICNTP